MLGNIAKIFDPLTKKFEGFQDAIREVFFYLIGVAVDNGKAGKAEHGYKGYLFIWPFVIAFLIVLYLLASVFIVD